MRSSGSMSMWLLLLATFSLGGCTAGLHRPYNPADRSWIHSIGVLTPVVAEQPEVRMMVHPGQNLGLVGMLIAADDREEKSHSFNIAIGDRGLDFRRSFDEEVRHGLRAAGYTVQSVVVNRDTGLLNDYPAADGSVDAYLDLDCDLVGYTAAGLGAPYRPTVYLNVRLVRARDARVLYQDRIAYNAFGDGEGAVTLTPAPDYRFDAFDQLLAAPDRAVEGLQVAMRATGHELVRQLR